MLAALVWMVAGLTAVAISDRVGTPGLGVAPRTVLVLAITWAAVLVVLLIMVLVAAFAGKPRHLVLAPCRGMSLGQIERWARTTAQLPEGFRGAYGLWGS